MLTEKVIRMYGTSTTIDSSALQGWGGVMEEGEIGSTFAWALSMIQGLVLAILGVRYLSISRSCGERTSTFTSIGIDLDPSGYVSVRSRSWLSQAGNRSKEMDWMSG